MVSTHKVSGDSAAGFANYLTSGQSRGDYYAGGEHEEGAETGETGFWHGSPAALERLGLHRDRPVTRSELVAVMRGVSPRDAPPRSAPADTNPTPPTAPTPTSAH